MTTVRHGSAELHCTTSDQRLPWHRGDDTVVFHHGLGACADLWLGWLPSLADRYRTVRFDMRGHGRTTAPAADPWSLETLLGDLDAVVQASGGAPVHLVGESIGGTIALAYALTWPERVRTLTISNGAHRGATLQGLRDWAEIIERDGMAGWSRMMMTRRFYPGALGSAAARWFETQQSTADPAALLGALDVLVGTDLGADLPRATMPVLILHPDASPFIAVTLAAELAELLPDARLKVLPHAKHGMPLSHAAECSAALRAFLLEHT